MPSVSKPVPPVKTTTRVVSCEPFAVPDEDAVGVLLTTLSGKKGVCSFYRCARIDCLDLAYQLDKLSFEDGTDPTERGYAVNLSLGTCTCKGCVRFGSCKHLSGVRVLFEEGVLP